MTSLLGATGPLLEQGWAWYVLLGTVALFLLGARTVLRLARRHEEADHAGTTKAIVAIVLSLVLAGGGVLVLVGFEKDAEAGIHTTLTTALNITVGESDYIDAGKTIVNKEKTIHGNETALGLEGKLAALNATYLAHPTADNLTARNKLWGALNGTYTELSDAHVKMRLLTANHVGWLQVQPLLAKNDDVGARQLLDDLLSADKITNHISLQDACARDKQGYCLTPLRAAPIVHSYRDLHTLADVPVHEGIREAFEHQEEAANQMNSHLRWFVFPGVTGLALAPFAFVGGSILGNAFEPSSSVGFKAYPGKAAGFFLLVMGLGVLLTKMGLPPTLDLFGLFAIPFAAIVLWDLHRRSTEGQIAL